MSQIAGLQDFRQEGPPADIGTFQLPCSAMVFRYVFSGVTYTCAIRSGVRGWVLIDYGTDARAVIQSAINALTSGKIFISAGLYDILTYLSVSNKTDLTFEGEGPATVLRIPDGQSARSYIFGIGALRRVTFKNMMLYSTLVTSYGWDIFIDGGSAYLEDLRFEDLHFKGDGWGGASVAYFANLGPVYAKRIAFSRCRFEHSKLTNAMIDGLLIRSVKDLIVETCIWYNINNPIVPDSLSQKQGLIYKGNLEIVDQDTFHAEGCDIWDFDNIVYTGNMRDIQIASSTFSLTGLMLEGHCHDAVIVGSKLTRGIMLVDRVSGVPTRVLIAGNDIRGLNEVGTVGVSLGNNLVDIDIIANRISNFPTPVSLGAGITGLKIRVNSGYVTENTGTATITAAATSIATAHGCNYTPTAGDIDVKLTNLPTNDIGDVWLSAIGAANFTINCRIVPGAATAIFAWSVRRT